jgi:hypothetical protein
VRKVCGFYLLDESERLRLEGDSSGSLAAAAKAVALLQTVDDDAAYRRAHLQWCTAMRFTAHTAAIRTSEAPEEVSDMLLQVRTICAEIDDPFGAALCSQSRVYVPPPPPPPPPSSSPSPRILHLSSIPLPFFISPKRSARALSNARASGYLTLTSGTRWLVAAASRKLLPAALLPVTRSSACVTIKAWGRCRRLSHGAAPNYTTLNLC